MIKGSVSSGTTLLRARLLGTTGIVIGVLAAITASAHGQEAGSTLTNTQATAPVADDAPVTEVIVTGTLIRGKAPVGSPLVSVTADDIKRSGATNPREILGTLPELTNFNQSFRPTTGGAQGGVFAPSIRNLPTLTLINSHRAAGIGTLSTSADPNAIPALALERVEVVPDGSSATYGSDAVGGVVNFITRKKFNGLEASVRYGTADSYHNWDAGFVGGKIWTGGSALVAFEHTENSSLSGLDRPDYSISDLRPYGGTDNRSNACALPNVSVGGVSYAYPALAPNTTNLCDTARQADILPADKRDSVFASIHQDLTDTVSFWAEGNFSDHLQTLKAVPFTIQATIPNSNPYFLPVPGTAATSENVTYSAANLLPNSAFISRADQKQYDISTGLDARLASSWSVHAFVNYGHSSDDAPEAIAFNQGALAAAAAGTTSNTALDPFGTGTSADVIAAIGNWQYETDTTQEILQGVVTADGTIFTLPGGDVKLAVGGEARKETFDSVFYNGPVGGSVQGAVSADRTVYSAFGELAIPIVGDSNAVPGIRALNLSASVRYDDYSDFGSTTNPKIGVDWTVVDGVKIRGSWGKSFLAPSLSDLYAIDGKFVTAGAPVARAFLGNDPQINGEYNAYVVAGGNPGLDPETADTWSVGAEFQPRSIRGFTARVTYYNVDFTNLITVPSASGGSIFTNPAFAQFLIRNPTPEQIAAYSAGLPSVVAVPIDPSLPTTLFDLRRQNLAALETNGLDLSARYTWAAEQGQFTVGGSANYVFKSDQTPAPGSAPVNQLDQALPKWRSRGQVDWRGDAWSAQVAVNYQGAYTNQAVIQGGQVQFDLPAIVTTDFYLGYTFGGQAADSGTEISLNVRNAFDEKPPIGPAGPRMDVDVVGRVAFVGLRKRW